MMPTESEMIDKGWIRLGVPQAPITKIISRAFRQRLDWRTREAAGLTWAQPRPRYLREPRLFFSVTKLVDAASYREASAYKTLEEYLPPAPHRETIASIPSFPEERVADWAAEFDSLDWWRTCHRIQTLIMFCEPQARARRLREHVAPWFFTRFPQGRIDFLVIDDDYRWRTYMVRKLYQLWGIPEVSPDAVLRLPPETLVALHGLDQQFVPVLELNVCFGFFYPLIYGFEAHQITSAVLFQFGEGVDAVPPVFPGSFEHWWRSSSAFEEREKRLRRFRARAEGANVEPEPMLVDRRWERDEWFLFFDRYIEGLNRMYARALNFPLYRGADGTVDYRHHFQMLMTILRLALETELLTSGLIPFLRKTLAFDVIDQFAILLAGGDPNSRKQADLFGTILTRQWLEDRLAGVLTRLPEPFGPALSEAVKRLSELTHSTVLEGVFVPQKRPSTEAEVEQLVLQVVRQLRNTKHGYFLTDDRFHTHLAAHTGNLTDAFHHVALLLWMSLLEEPAMFLRPPGSAVKRRARK
jgi:hypothetical protein